MPSHIFEPVAFDEAGFELAMEMNLTFRSINKLFAVYPHQEHRFRHRYEVECVPNRRRTLSVVGHHLNP